MKRLAIAAAIVALIAFGASAQIWIMSPGGGGASLTGAGGGGRVTGPPTVTGVSPSSGTTAGGTSVTISGTNFTGATVVDFGLNSASFTVTGAGTILATSPAGSAGTVDVTVTTPQGTSMTSAADQFTYATLVACTAGAIDLSLSTGCNLPFFIGGIFP